MDTDTASRIRMDEEELNAFLGRGGTGVLSFARGPDEPPYSLPVSYGYNEAHGDFYFRLAFPAGAAKADAVDAPVSLVAHARGEDGWRSAVATGHLEELAEEDYDSSALQGMWQVEIPLVDIFDREPKEITFRYFRLDPDDLTGRKEVRGQY